jgi:competence protein ComEC
MRHAAVRSLGAAAIGVALGGLLHLPWWVGLCAAIAAAGLALLTRGLSLYVTLAAAAMLYQSAREPPRPDSRLYRQEGFRGVVVSEPTFADPTRVVVELAKPWRGKVTVWLRDSSLKYRYGDLIEVRSRIRALSFPRNPGLADFNEVFRRRGFVGDANGGEGAVSILSHSHGQFWMTRLVVPVRRYVLRVIDRFLPGQEGALLVGLMLGGRQGLPKDVQDAFNDAGIVHILAVSGMNVSVVVGVIWLLLGVLGMRGWWRFGIGAGVVGFYVLLAGGSAAPARAGLMALAALLSVPLQRRITPLATLSAAGLVLLIIDPMTVFDVGAQLSFAATAGIVLIARPGAEIIRRFRLPRRLKNWVVLPMIVSIAASLGTTPLLLHHFFRVQPLAFLTSTLVVPLVGVAMPLGFIVVIVNLVSGWLAGIFAQTAWAACWLLLKLAVLMGSLDWAIWEPGRMPWLAVGWVYLLGLLLLQFRRHWARVGFAMVLLGGLSVISWTQAIRKPENSVTFLDPRQGDVTVLEDSLGRLVVIDAGINRTNVLREFLRSRGVHRLAAVVVTHPDNDHYGGLLDIDDRVRIDKLLVSATQADDTAYNALLARLAARGTEVITAGRGTRLQGYGFDIGFLWPDRATVTALSQGTARTNDVSLVALVKHGLFSMLLTGDLDDPDLLSADSLRADLLKSPHHGSKKGNEESLYERVGPGTVVVMGRYPTPAGLEERFKGSDVEYVNTRVDGAVVLRFRGAKPVLYRPFARLPESGVNLR